MSFLKMNIFLLPILLLVASCAPEYSKIVVAEFADNKILMDEFEKAYSKNSGGYESAKQDSVENFQKFLDLYVNYKMKLRDAVVRGYTNDSEMQKEYTDYKINVGSTLFTEKEFYEPNLKALYDRRKYEFKVAHIFLLPDSIMTEEKIKELGNDIISKANSGEDWNKLVNEYTKDAYTKEKGGVVGYVTAGQILSTELEEAVYKAPVGTVSSEIIRSSFGFHIIKVINKQPRKNSLKASHILTAFKDSTENVDSAAAYQKILEVQKQLQAGADFAELAKKYSDDKYSGQNGGELGVFGRGMMVPEFEEVAFKLNIGEVSDIFSTQFGYHIIKLTDEVPMPSYEDSKNDLRNIYQKVWYNKHHKQFIENLKKELNYEINSATLDTIFANIDSVKIGNLYWDSSIREKIGNSTLFTLNNKNFICDSLFAYTGKKGLYTGGFINQDVINDIMNSYLEEKVIEEKALTYDQVDHEFASLMEDYRNGIYLFKILEEEVWNKINVDSVKLVSFYDNVKNNYRWKDRVEYQEIRVASDSLARSIYSEIGSGAEFDSLVLKYNKSRFDINRGLSGLVEHDVNDLSAKAYSLSNIGDVSEPVKYQDLWYVIKLVKKEDSRIKTFDEVRTELTGILQEQESKRLEEEYINNLKTVYKPKYYYNELSKAFKQ